MRRTLTYIRDFGSVTTLHGVIHFIAINRHPAENYLWLSVTVFALISTVYLIANNWQRYSANPTVLSLEKNYRSWRVPFPAATICLLDRVNVTAATAFVYRHWRTQPSDEKFDYYMRFVQSVANLTYDNLHDFLQFQYDTELYTVDLADLALKVKFNLTYSARIFNPKYNHLKFKDTITEMGICHTYNGMITDYISLSSNVKKTVSFDLNPPYCNFLNSLCYARIENLLKAIRYYIHSPWEIPDLSSRYFPVSPNKERDTSFRFLQTKGSMGLQDLLPRQRRCRFPDEPLPHDSLPVYSFNLCRMRCRQQLAFDKCGCAPYFYTPHDDIPVCTVKGLACLAAYVEQVTTLINPDGSYYNCHCTMPCSSIEYYVDEDDEKDWNYQGATDIRFRWAIEIYSKTRVQRDVIFGFEDLLVSFGGTAAFFLGCSVVTFVELIYFFTLRLFWYLQPKKASHSTVVPEITVSRW